MTGLSFSRWRCRWCGRRGAAAHGGRVGEGEAALEEFHRRDLDVEALPQCREQFGGHQGVHAVLLERLPCVEACGVGLQDAGQQFGERAADGLQCLVRGEAGQGGDKVLP